VLISQSLSLTGNKFAPVVIYFSQNHGEKYQEMLQVGGLARHGELHST
jgi:hypothetical protein